MSTSYIPGSSKLYIAPITSGVVGTYVKIGQTVDLNSPEPEVGEIDITNDDSPSNAEEIVPGRFKLGTFEFEFVCNSLEFDHLFDKFLARSINAFMEVYQDGSGWLWQGFITKPSIEGKTVDDALMAKMSVRNTTLADFVATLPAVTGTGTV